MNMIETQELSITHPQFIQPTMMQLNPLHDPVVRKQVKMEAVNLSIFYKSFKAINNVNIPIYSNEITAIIGPSGCGKSTLLRSLNRMNDLTVGSYIEGEVKLNDLNIYAKGADVVDIRRRIGMVFQRPNPFMMSIFDNVAYGPRLYGIGNRSSSK